MPFTPRLSDNELLALFGCPADHRRWLAAADSQENLDILVYRERTERDPRQAH